MQYGHIEHALAAQLPAAEAHGSLCGLLCARGDAVASAWLEEIAEAADERRDKAELQHLLAGLHDETLAMLTAGDMRFEPLLPNDDCGIAQRADALAHWCQGFLYGLGIGGVSALPADVREILADFRQIALATGDESPAGEEDEAAWAELVEFVRVSVQLVFDELAAARHGPPVSSTTVH